MAEKKDKKIPGHMLAFRLNDDEQKVLDGICKRSEMSRPKVVKALIKLADGKTLKPVPAAAE